MKKTLVFHAGRAPKGERTNWVMHEYRLEGEDAAAGIPQDSFVVCRIFQKAGPGPQNGAQYGAPFVEEEWEEDDEDVGLLPVERDDAVHHQLPPGPMEAPGAMEKGYLQMSDLTQSLGDQNGNGTVGLPVSDTSNNSNHSEDIDGNSGDILNDPNLGSNFLQYVEPGEQNSLMLNQNVISNFNAEDFLNNSSPSPSDGFLELKDFVDAANMDYPLGNESTIWPSDGWVWKTPDSLGPVNGANYDIPPLPDDQTFQPDELEQLLQSIQGNSHLGSSTIDPSHSSITNSAMPEDGSIFYDAPFDSTICDDRFGQGNGILGSPATNLSGIGMVDDGMPYYDAMDDNLFNDILGSIPQPAASSSHAFNGPILTQEVNNTMYTYSPTQKVLEPNFVVGAPSSARLPEAGSQLNCVVLPDGQAKSSTMGKRFVKMLDSISAPPAFAAEFPANLRKSLAPIPGARPNTFHVSAEVISIGSLAVTSGPDKWALQKDQGMELLFSTDFEPDTRIHYGCNTITAVLRGGFCLFFFSAIMLLLSYEVGMCISGK